jgi:alkyldihydroxyacetonephosphate synthase
VGPALHELLIGAEGSLGVILEAVLRVNRLPARVIGHGFDFPDLTTGLTAMRLIVQAGIRPLVIRLYDLEDTAFQHSEAQGCLLVVGVAGEPEVASAEDQVVRRLVGEAKDLGEGEYNRWRERRFHLSVERLKQSLEARGSFVDTIEVAGPWDRLPGLHAEVKGIISQGAVGLCHFSHPYLSGCCAYFTFAGSAADDEEAMEAYARAWVGTMQACLRQGVTIGHHHGVGLVRGPWVKQEMGEWWSLWEKLRAGVDPDGIMNPSALGGETSKTSS